MGFMGGVEGWRFLFDLRIAEIVENPGMVRQGYPSRKQHC